MTNLTNAIPAALGHLFEQAALAEPGILAKLLEARCKNRKLHAVDGLSQLQLLREVN